MLIDWENNSTLILYTKELSVIEDVFDLSVKVDFTCNICKDDLDVFQNWYDTNCLKNIILSWEIRNKREFFLFESCFPNFINIDNEGYLSSFKLKFKKYQNITRKYKIKKMINV